MPFPLPLINELGLTTPQGLLREGGLQTKGAAPPPRPPHLRAPGGPPQPGSPAPSSRHPRRLWLPAPALAGPALDTGPAPACRILAPGLPLLWAQPSGCRSVLSHPEPPGGVGTQVPGLPGPRSCLPARDAHLWAGHRAVTETVLLHLCVSIVVKTRGMKFTLPTAFSKCLCMWLPQALAAACRDFGCGMCDLVP